jgi:hypothetical protein
MRKTPIAIAATAVLASSGAYACKPAPSCWIESGPEYLRAVCDGYAKDHRTVTQIASYLDEPERITEFVKACGKLHVHFRQMQKPKPCLHFNPEAPFANRAPAWAVKSSPGIAMSATDPIWQHATCDAATHSVEWNLPGSDQREDNQ